VATHLTEEMGLRVPRSHNFTSPSASLQNETSIRQLDTVAHTIGRTHLDVKQQLTGWKDASQKYPDTRSCEMRPPPDSLNKEDTVLYETLAMRSQGKCF
jgi:hypothetical protein